MGQGIDRRANLGKNTIWIESLIPLVLNILGTIQVKVSDLATIYRADQETDYEGGDFELVIESGCLVSCRLRRPEHFNRRDLTIRYNLPDPLNSELQRFCDNENLLWFFYGWTRRKGEDFYEISKWAIANLNKARTSGLLESYNSPHRAIRNWDGSSFVPIPAEVWNDYGCIVASENLFVPRLPLTEIVPFYKRGKP